MITGNFRQLTFALSFLLLMFAGCVASGNSKELAVKVFKVNSFYKDFAHRNIIDLMRIDGSLLGTWGRDTHDSDYYYPEVFNCSKRNDVTKEMIDIALDIESIRTMDFSWSNVTDEMLDSILNSHSIDRLYLDGVKMSNGTFESLARHHSIAMISAVNSQIDPELAERLRNEFPDKEIYID